jgi:hypothetical protein
VDAVRVCGTNNTSPEVGDSKKKGVFCMTNNDERVENIDKKISQLKARKQAIVNRERQAERKADTRRKIIIGGIFLKYFPDCKTIDPKDEKNFASVVSAVAALANDKEFLNLWLSVKQKMKSGV